MFHAAGYSNVVNVVGGTLAWEEAELPFVRETNTMSLTNQVWMMTGLLTLLGTYLGHTVHPSFFSLAATAALALIITGIKDDKSLEVPMSRMPWNRNGQDGASGSA